MDFAVQLVYRVKNEENEKRDKYLHFAREPKKAIEYESDSDMNCNWFARNNLHRLDKLEIGGRSKTIQNTLLSSARILVRVLGTYHSGPS